MELNVDSAVAMPQSKRKGMILVADGREVSPLPPTLYRRLAAVPGQEHPGAYQLYNALYLGCIMYILPFSRGGVEKISLLLLMEWSWMSKLLLAPCELRPATLQ
jgi:hypothetical protein